MNLFGYKIRKKYRICFYYWMRWLFLLLGGYLMSHCETKEELIAYSYSYALIVLFLTLAIDNLTWRRGWNKYFNKRGNEKLQTDR